MAPTRREFLQNSRCFGCRSGSAPCPRLPAAQTGSPAAAGASPAGPGPFPALTAKRWAMAVHGGKCPPGCRDCIDACHLAHNVPAIGNPKDDVHWIGLERVERVFPAEAHPRVPEAIRKAFRTGSLQPLREPALRAGLPHEGHLQAGGRDRHDGLPPLHRLPVLHGRLSLRGAKHELPRSPAVHPQDQPGFSDPDQGRGGKMQLLRGAACPGDPSRLCRRLQGKGPGIRRSGRSPIGRPAPSGEQVSPSGEGRNWGRDRRSIIFCEDAVLEKALTGIAWIRHLGGISAALDRNRFFLLPPAARLWPGDHRTQPGCLLGALHRPVHLSRRDRGLGGDAGSSLLPARLQGLRKDHDPGGIPGRLRRDHVRHLHLRRSRPPRPGR